MPDVPGPHGRQGHGHGRRPHRRPPRPRSCRSASGGSSSPPARTPTSATPTSSPSAPSGTTRTSTRPSTSAPSTPTSTGTWKSPGRPRTTSTPARASGWSDFLRAGQGGADRRAGPLLQHAHRPLLARGGVPLLPVRPRPQPQARHSLPQRDDQRRAHPGGLAADDPGRLGHPLLLQRDQQRPRPTPSPRCTTSARPGGKARTAAAC